MKYGIRIAAVGATAVATTLLSMAPVQAAEYRETEKAATVQTADPAPASIHWKKYECGDGSTGRVRCQNQHRYYESRGCDYLKAIQGNATTGYYFWHACA